MTETVNVNGVQVRWDPKKETWAQFYARAQRVGSAVSTNDEPTWCPDCGRMMPWKHPCWPTLKARVANRILRAINRVEDLVRDWRDADALSTDEYMRRQHGAKR